MNTAAFFAVWPAGSLVGKLSDPLSWVLVGAVFFAGATARPAWWPVAGAVVATIVNVALVYSWWLEIGVANQAVTRSALLLTLFLIISVAAYLFGRLVHRLTRPSQGPAI
jgi:hypothetical protein